jgi:hypothetical protein
LSKGQDAERLVFERLRAALPSEYRLGPDVRRVLGPTDRGGKRDTEATLFLAHADKGLLVLEIEAGQISRNGQGQWFAGHIHLNPPPFELARIKLGAVLARLQQHADWEPGSRPIAGYVVALPDVELALTGKRMRLVGGGIDPELILDRTVLSAKDPFTTRKAVDRAFEIWAETATDTGPLGERGLALLETVFTSEPP